MSSIKLKSGDKIFEKYNNKVGGGSPKYKKIYNNIHNHAKYLKDKINENSIYINNKYFFSFKYENIPSKTKRIILRKKIKSFNNIPQVDMVTYFINNKYYSKISYFISKKEYEELIEKLNMIIEKPIYNENTFNSLPARIKEYIMKFNEIKEIQKMNEWNSIDIDTFHFIKLVPLFSRDEMEKIFNELSINTNEMNWDTYVILLNPKDFFNFKIKYSFLISRIYENEVFSVEKMDLKKINDTISLDTPRNVTIGVIDSGISLPSIFNDYVTTEDRRQYKKESDFVHGSGVVSIIIANDKLNPGDNDNFGQFKVKHFELLEIVDETMIPTVNNIYLFEQIGNIIKNNSNIKIWNLSLGSIKKPFSINVSQLGKLLDVLAMKFNCLFIIAAGNNGEKLGPMSIATPADSLNALSIGSVTNMKNGISKTNYSSWGPVTHYIKPEIAHFGGPDNMDLSPIRMFCSGKMTLGQIGTSFAAPKIARFAAHLLDEGLSPLQIKANIIGSATRETFKNKSSSFGWVNFKELHTLDGEITLLDIKPRYLPFQYPKNTKSVHISSSTFTTNAPIFGEEYNLMNVELSLVGYKNNLSEPERTKKGKIQINEKPKQSKYKVEEYKRYEDGKYFTSKKKDYLIVDIKSVEKQGYKLALRIRKLNLYNIEKEEKLNVAFCIKFKGNIDVEELKNINQNIIDIKTHIQIEV